MQRTFAHEWTEAEGRRRVTRIVTRTDRGPRHSLIAASVIVASTSGTGASRLGSQQMSWVASTVDEPAPRR